MIRTVHHFACTGGTLLAKCLASMPRTKVLSEVEPHSRQLLRGKQRFWPTDLINLVRVGTYPSSTELESEIFLRGLEAILDDCRRQNFHLVLRDHAHSKYCFSKDVFDFPSLRDVVSSRFPVSSVLLTRHPLDSYLSLAHNDWIRFDPPTLNEYSRRYLVFLADHEDCPAYSYERLVDQPAKVLQEICGKLEIPFDERFEDQFSDHRLSGDSGRSSGTIAPRPRRPVPGEVAREISSAPDYAALCDRLGYEPDRESAVADSG